ncbi:SpoIID/LytB domain-containing protein [Botrimarina sp.]|uniref:SpoIID/LytB domain-containing protein n=1 Tax=Botrimarina sp. TaxID=2795802 RepID=UPI0032EEEB4E
MSLRPLFAALIAAMAAPVCGQSEFAARPTILVDVDNNPALRRAVPTESDYVPNVVVSENGLASFEALKAQAVAARTFAYYKLDGSGVIGDGQNDQVYSGSGSPRQIHFDAAAATEGEILWVRDNIAPERDVLIASFYVAGAIPTAPFDPQSPSARPAFGAPSLGDTERFVTYTYEEGLVGGFNRGTTLGFRGSVTNPNWPNRGAMSQNGADYLSDNSINYLDILKYYYGADIQVRTATTAGAPVGFGRKVLTSFDDYGSGRASDGVIDGHEGVFNRSLTFSGSTTANLAGSDAVRDGAEAHEGSHSQRLDLVYDESSGEDFFVRHVAGARFSDFGGSSNAASRVANLQFESIGSVGFWLKTTDPGLEVSLAIDDPETGDRGVRRSVVADGQWRQYKWRLDNPGDWEAWTAGGDGQITGVNVSLDSIQLFGSSDATVYLDTVFWDPGDTFNPTAVGDFNADGLVDAADYSVWRDNWLRLEPGNPADANGDGFVGNADYDIWAMNFGTASEAAAAVPEASGAVAALLTLAGVANRGRPGARRRNQ